MAYKRVYAPTGEPFDVPEVRANDLILQKGWTQQPPVFVPAIEDEPEKENPVRRRRRKSAETEAPAEETPSGE